MNQRSSLIVFCFASALVGGIVATQSSGRDRATAQVASIPADAASVALPSRCNQCAWDYKRIEYMPGPTRSRIQVFPVGVSGVVHSIFDAPAPDGYTCSLWTCGEGDGASPAAIVWAPLGQFAGAIDGGVHFSSGLWVEVADNVNGCNPPANRRPAMGILYRLEVPLSTAPEK